VAQSQALTQLEYFLFGRAEELFLGHVINQQPDFDQVLSVRAGGHQFTDEQLRHGVRVAFAGRANLASQKLREQENLSGQVQLAGATGSQAVGVALQVGTEFYFEVNDLAVPPKK